MPKTRKVKISSEFVKDWGLEDDDDEDKEDWSPPKKAKRTKKSTPKKKTKGWKRRAISKISVVDSPSTKEKPRKRKERENGRPYSVTGNWYIATGYLQDIERLLDLFEKHEGSRFSDFASCWQSLSFSLVFRGRQNFKELLEFTEEIALLTKRFLWPNYSHKKNIGALYTIYGITYKHPVRTFFKVRLTKEEYRLLKDMVEPYRSKSDNPDPAFIFRKMEVEGAFFNCASGEEHCLEFYSYEREVVDLEYKQHLMAKKAKVSQLINEKQMEQDDILLQHYHEVKCKILGDGAKPEASLDMVNPDTVKGMQKIIQDTTERNKEILDARLYDVEESPVRNNKCIGLRRSAIRDKAIRVKPRCLYEQRDRDEQEKSSEKEAAIDQDEDAEEVEQEGALMEKWNQKSPGEGQMKSRKRKTDKCAVEVSRKILFDKEVQEFMKAPPVEKPDTKPILSSETPVGDLNEDIIKIALGRKGPSSSAVQTRRKAKEEAEAKKHKTPDKGSGEPHTPKKGTSQASAVCDSRVAEKSISPNRRTRKAPSTPSRSPVSSVKGMGKTSVLDQKTVSLEKVKEENKATEKCVTSPKPRRKRGRPRKTEKAQPAVEEVNDAFETEKSQHSSPEKSQNSSPDKSLHSSLDKSQYSSPEKSQHTNTEKSQHDSPETSTGQYLERRKRKRERPRKYALFEASNEEEEVIQAVRPKRRKGFHLEEQIDSNGLSKEAEMTNIVRRLVHEKSPVVDLDPDSTTIIVPQEPQQQQTSLSLTRGSRTWPGLKLPGSEQNLTFSYARKNQSSSSSFADTGSTLVTLRLKVNINRLIRKVMFQMTKKKWLEVKNDQKRLDAIMEKLKPHLLLNLTGSKGDPSQCIVEDIVEVPASSKGRHSSADPPWARKRGRPCKTPNITTSGGQHMLFSYKTTEEPTCQSSPSPCQLKVVKLPDGKVVLVKPLGPESASDIDIYESTKDKPKKKKSPFPYMIIPLPPNYNVGGVGNRESRNEMIDANDPITLSNGSEAETGSYIQREVIENYYDEDVEGEEIIDVGEELRFSTLGNDNSQSETYPDEVEEETTCDVENDVEPVSSPVQETNIWSADEDSVIDDDGLSPDEEEDLDESYLNAREPEETMSSTQRVSDLQCNEHLNPDRFVSDINAISKLQGSEVTPPRTESETIEPFSQPATVVTSIPLQASTPQKTQPYSVYVTTSNRVPREARGSVEGNGSHLVTERAGACVEWVSNTEKSGTRETGLKSELITSDLSTSTQVWKPDVIIPVSANDATSIYPVQESDSSPQYAKVLESIPVELDLSRNPLKFEDQVSITIQESEIITGDLPAHGNQDQVGSLSRKGASCRIANALELCQLSVSMAEATAAAPGRVDYSQDISAHRVVQGNKQAAQNTPATSAVHPVVLYTPVLLQNLVKTEVSEESAGTDVGGAEGGDCTRKDVNEEPNQMTERNSASPKSPEEHKVFSPLPSMEEPTNSESQNTLEVSKKVHQSSKPQNFQQVSPEKPQTVTEFKAGHHITSVFTDIKTPQDPVPQKRVSRTPVCSFLFSSKFKPLSKLSTCVGEATGKVQARPRVRFFSKSYLFPKGRKSV